MCLLVLAWQCHPRYRLIVAANRDEFHARPAAALAPWDDAPDVLGGRDLAAGGTWLALDRTRRFGVVTNFRDLQSSVPGAPTRGGLIPAYLRGPASAASFLESLEARATEYAGFNLLLADEQGLWYACNRITPFARALPRGIYGLSNRFLDTPWPKLTRVRARFERWLAAAAPAAEELLGMLADREPAGAGDEPIAAGLAPEWERVLSAPFVLDPRYGTRSTTLALLEASGAALVLERRFDQEGRISGETELTLNAHEWNPRPQTPL